MKPLNLVATCVFGGVILIAGIALAGQEKVDVCHITGMFDFGSGDVPVGHVILIADPAYPAHLDHGDPDAYTLVYDADGNEYCTAEVVEPPPPPTYACDAYTEGNFSVALSLIDSDPSYAASVLGLCVVGSKYLNYYGYDYSDSTGVNVPLPYISIIDEHLDTHCGTSISESYISLCTTDPWCADPLIYGCSRWNSEEPDFCTEADDLALAQCAIELRTHIAEIVEPPLTKLVFVTSETYNGNLGGLEGADAICQAHAGTASLPGTYKAWLSDGFNVDPPISPSTTFYRSTVPYVRVDGETVADNWDDLVDGNLSAPINVDQNGNVISEISAAWTNTDPGGDSISDLHTPFDCGGFTNNFTGYYAVIGNIDFTDTRWTEHVSYNCEAYVARLYCFQQ